jgi:AAA domain
LYDNLIMSLTLEQENAFDLFKEYVDSVEKTFLLTGCAGSGKSFLTRAMVNYIYNQGFSLCVLAPTHKALNVIQNYLNIDGDSKSFECFTLAKFLFKKQVFHDGGEMTFVRDSHLFMKHKFDYIFIDEASMIDSDDFDCFMKLHRSKIVFIGDSYQLPPVGETHSVVFKNVNYIAKLSTTMRTNYSGLQSVYDQFRNYVDDDELELENNDHVMVYETKNEFFNCIKSKFINDGTCKIIAYRNIVVNMYNTYVRQILFDEAKDLYLPGEQLIFNQTYSDEYTNNTEVTVQSVSLIQKHHPYTGICYDNVYELKLTDGGILYKVSGYSKIKYDNYFNSMLSSIKSSKSKNKSKRWSTYYKHRYAFDPPITYGYALTAYKSQGSTISNTFVDLDDIYYTMLEKDPVIMKKAMYTSITRASDKVFVLL